jgi:outer membrane protein OmpA-like peptidoglycan-associated protein
VDASGLVTNPAGTAYVFSKTGNLNLQAYSGGAYWTHYGPGGWYLDAILQGTAYTGDATTVVSKLPTDGSGFIASLEGGYPIPLPLGPHFILEPQGQIIYQRVGFHDAFDNEATIGLGTTSGATGRLGVRGQWTINTEQGQVWQPYVRANVWHNWGANAALTSPASALSVPLLENTTWLEFAGGVTVKVNANLSFYGQFGYEFAVAPSIARYNGVKGDIGLRLTFGQPPPPPAPALAPAPVAARSYLVFFDWDKATLTDRARQIIRDAADNSTKVQYTRIAVNGYTDTSGTPRYNQGLSVRRAQAVAAELIKDGVLANVITIQGFGDTHLLVPTGPGVREPQNRRVEIIIQ